MSATPPPRTSWAGLPRLALACAFALAAGVVAVGVRLWPEWRHNPDLSHGLFMPVVFVLLLWESRRGTPRWLRSGATGHAGFFLLLLGGLAALAAAGLYAAVLGWNNAFVNFVLTLSLVLLLGAGLMALAGDAIRLVPCNWPAVAAIGLWLLSAPIPPGTYSRLTLALQLWVSENTVRVLHVLGIAAVRHGNIIELARATVGVEEACSGVRSLLSCVFAGVFFSATLVRRPWGRALLVALSAPLALSMNFLRSLVLTLLANAGVDIAGAWHDATGYAVLGVTAALLGGLALLLERHESAAPDSAIAPAPVTGPASRIQLRSLAAGLALATALTVVFVVKTRPPAAHAAPVPNLYALLPEKADRWNVTTSTELFQFRDTLHTEHLAQRTYTRDTAAGVVQVTIYLAYWRAGQTSVSQVALHTPDACWPGSGWTAVAVPTPRVTLTAGERTLPPAEYRLFQSLRYPQHVWFWHLYDGRPIFYGDPYSPTQMLGIAWQFGFRRDGEQLFVRISSNRPWAEIAAEPLLAQFLVNAHPLGL